MNKADIIVFAVRNFFRRKMRSFLTVLGVVIGTAAVVIMISINLGMMAGYEASIEQWSNLRLINVYPSWSEGKESPGNIKCKAGHRNQDRVFGVIVKPTFGCHQIMGII